MDKFDEMMKKLVELNITQLTSDLEGNIPDNIWDKYFESNAEEVDNGLYVDTHMWYETSIIVFLIFGRYLGVRMVTNTSPIVDVYDCYHTIKFIEMEPVSKITYIAKEK